MEKPLKSDLFQVVKSFLLGLFLATVAVAQESLLCRKAYIDGFLTEANHAKKILGAPTTAPSKIEIHLTAGTRDGKAFLYAHSNLRTDSEYPSKLLLQFSDTDEVLAIEEIVANLVTGGGGLSETTKPRVWKVIKEHAVVFVDESVLQHPRFRDLDFSNLAHVHYFGKDITQLGENLFYKGSSLQAAKALRSSLHSKPTLERAAIGLVHDADSVRISKLMGVTLPDDNAAAVQEALKANSGKTVLMFGHVEKEGFTLSGTESVSFATLRTWAKDYKVDLVLLGCHTNTVGKINSLDVLRAIRSASDAANYGELFENLSSSGMRVLLDDSSVIANGDGSLSVALRGLAPVATKEGAGRFGHSGTKIPTAEEFGSAEIFVWATIFAATSSSQPNQDAEDGDVEEFPVLPSGAAKTYESVAAWVDAAAPVYKRANAKSYLITAQQWNSLAWFAALTGRMAVAEYAIAQIDETDILSETNIADTKAVIIAIKGEWRQAIELFEVFVDDKSNRAFLREKRVGWIVALWRQEKPFTPQVLRQCIADDD